MSEDAGPDVFPGGTFDGSSRRPLGRAADGWGEQVQAKRAPGWLLGHACEEFKSGLKVRKGTYVTRATVISINRPGAD